MSEEKKSIDQRCLTAAKAGDVQKAIDLYNRGANINCVLMGGSDCEIKAARKELCEFACNHGACLLFAFKQDSTTSSSACGTGPGNSFYTRVKMLKGPGEATKGTFKGSSSC